MANYSTLPWGVQSSTPLSWSKAWGKEEGWRQEGHSAIKEVAPKPPCMKLAWDECVWHDLKSLGLSIGENELELDLEKTSNLCVAWKADDKR